MKKRYENKNKIVAVCLIFLVIIFGFGLFLINQKVVLYEKFSGVVSKEDVLVFLISKDELKLFYKNKIVFIENDRKKFVIKKIEKDVVERNGILYSQVFVEVDISNKNKVNDIIDVSLAKRNVKSINIFKIIWEDG